jgi:serine phosphatase RsbU (regulator of sigma subunit)
MFGEERLKGIIMKEAPHGAERLLKTVLAALDEFTGNQLQTDDITIMIVERAR